MRIYVSKIIISMIFLLISFFSANSQNNPEYKIRHSAKKVMLFPISDNQKMYDILSYDFHFDFNIPDTSFTGRAEVRLKPITTALNRVHLDLAKKSIFLRTNNVVDSIILSNNKVSFTHNDTTLMVNLDKNYNPGDVVKLLIYYRTKLDNFYLMQIDKNSRTLIFNLSEPFGARFWIPCKDYPEDKADSVRMTITTPSEYYAASNGILESVTESNGKKTFVWVEKYPIATYLISVAIYPYIVFKDYYRYSENDSMEIINYVVPEDIAAFNQVRNLTPKMMEFFKSTYGEYPFINEKYGHAQIPFSGGMENQTITSLGLWNENLMAHELAHSWFGNSVTCNDFHYIWLNEGFATYSTALYLQNAKGKTAFDNEMNACKYFSSGQIYRSNMNDDMSIFHTGLVYNKAAWVLHMLRGITGDEKFYLILKNYYDKNRYSISSEEKFRTECEKIYGKDLSWFFYQWIYQEYFPTYKYDWQKTQTGSTFNVKLNIEQTGPATYIFKMPIQINFKSGAWDTTIVIWDSLQTQKFDFTFTKNIDSLFLDKNDFILKKLVSSMTGIEKLDRFDSYNLEQNYPNPFNSSTVINYYIASPGFVKIKLFDILGREVSALVNKYHDAGVYKYNLNADKFASGIYFYNIEINGYRNYKKMILLR